MKSAINTLADYLARRDHSEKELREKLQRLSFTMDEIESAMNAAKRQNWLLPPEELSQKVAQQLRQKKKGTLYIQNYLRQKGLPSVICDEGEELARALEIVDSISNRDKAARMLHNRGFTSSIIAQVISQIPVEQALRS